MASPWWMFKSKDAPNRWWKSITSKSTSPTWKPLDPEFSPLPSASNASEKAPEKKTSFSWKNLFKFSSIADPDAEESDFSQDSKSVLSAEFYRVHLLTKDGHYIGCPSRTKNYPVPKRIAPVLPGASHPNYEFLEDGDRLREREPRVLA